MIRGPDLDATTLKRHNPNYCPDCDRRLDLALNFAKNERAMASPASADDQDLLPTAPDGAAAPLAPVAEGGLEPPDQGRPGRHQISPTHVPFLNFVRYLKGDREAIGDASYLVARHRAE